jgi:hypothetical protein
MGLLGDALELACRCPSLWRTARLRLTLTSDPQVQMREVERAQSNMGLHRTSPPGDPWQCPAQPGLSHSEAPVVAVSREKYHVESRQVDPSSAQREGDGSFWLFDWVRRLGPATMTASTELPTTMDHSVDFLTRLVGRECSSMRMAEALESVARDAPFTPCLTSRRCARPGRTGRSRRSGGVGRDPVGRRSWACVASARRWRGSCARQASWHLHVAPGFD